MRKFVLTLLLGLAVLLTAAQFPAPYCAENYPTVEAITKVQFGSINNTQPFYPAGPGHRDFTALSTAVTPGNSYTLTVAGSTSGGYTDYFRAFFDWNRDGDFDDQGESYDVGSITGSTGSDGKTASVNVAVPINASPGSTRMRVSKRYNNYPTPCLVFGSGQAHDYTVTVAALPPCTGSVSGGTATASAASVCPTTQIQIDVTGATTGVSGLSLQWEGSPDGNAWTAITGATAPGLTLFQNATAYYRRRIACGTTAAYSSAVQVTMKPIETCYCTPSASACASVRIDSVGFGTLSNVSACGAGGYTNYSSTVAAPAVPAGSYQPIAVKTGAYFLGRYVKVWIDFNQNGVYENNESTDLGQLTGSTNLVAKSTVRVPFDAKGGPTYMRVQVAEAYGSIPCNTYGSGETEDYKINVIASATPNAGFVMYVKAPATGANNGITWADAFTSLVPALAQARPKDTIKVAKGTYQPGTAQNAYFSMKDSVVVLAGYPATGNPADADRNWRSNQVILSGQLGTSASYDNVYTMLSGSNLSAATVWDGFVVENTDGYGSYSSSGAMVLQNSNAVIRNFIFRYNYGGQRESGAALTVVNGAPAISNSIFYNNFSVNSSKSTAYSRNASPGFYNCVFTGNSTSDSASALYYNGGAPQVVNCTFFNNAAMGLPEATLIVATAGANLQLANSVFFENKTAGLSYNQYSTDKSELLLANATAVIKNCLFQNYDTTGTNLLVGLNPRFRDTADLDGPDNLFFTADDGLQLTNPCSPAMNAGDNSFLAGMATDITGNPRQFNNGAVDLGAYEVQAVPAAPMKVVYVNKAATGANDGSSWANAFTDLQKALQYCADTVKIAAGTYVPSAGNQQTSFALESGRVILGGYPATGNPTDAQRNPAIYTTALSGKLPNGQSSFYVLKSHQADSTAVMDGITVKESVPTNTGFMGAVFLVNKARPVLRNCRITANAYGLVALRGSSALLQNCVLDSNKQCGALISASNIRLLNCDVYRNTTIIDPSLLLYSGGGVQIIDASPQFDSCLFRYNRSNLNGGAVVNSNSNPVFNYCRFTGNSAQEYGGNVYSDGSSPSFSHCIFNDTLGAYYGGSMANFNSSPEFRFCEFRNSRSLYNSGLMLNDNSNANYISCVFYNTGTLTNKNYSRVRLTNCIATVPATPAGPFLTNQKTRADVTNVTLVRQGVLFSGSVAAALIYNADSSQLTIRNSILWGGKFDPAEPVADIVNDPSTLMQPSGTVMENCLTQAYGTNGVNGNIVGVDPRLFEYNDADGVDDKFFTADDGLRLTPCSPALNTGNNGANSEAVDILNNPRRIGTVDMGAYEFQSGAGGAPKTVYVNAAAAGNGDGSSWANAYTSLWQGINNSCADTVKVAAGIYKPARFSRDSAFLLQHNKVYLGGYPAAGNPAETDRKPRVNLTVLSGNIGSPTDSTDNSYHVVLVNNADSAVTLDGFVIQDGLTNPSSNNVPLISGGGVSVIASKVTILNCTVQNNTAVWSGGGIYVGGSKRLRISNSIIRRNRAVSRGGGISLDVASAGLPGVIENSVITENQTAGQGGGIYHNANNYYYSGGMRFNNLIFYRNAAVFEGGGMYNFTTYNTYITNCTFVGNNGKLVQGSGLYNYIQYQQDNNFPYMYNNIFKGNSYAPNGSDENYQSSDVAENTCPVNNCYRPNIRYNRFQSSWSQYDMNNTGAQPLFVNEADADGPDDQWLTADDGLRLSACSPLIDFGWPAAVAGIPTDALGTTRIIGAKPDPGAYEFNGSSLGAPLPSTPADTLLANKEYTTADGWTHYYKDCVYLLSLQKRGKAIGTVGDGTFSVKVVVTAPYGSGQATNLTAAQYNAGGLPWHSMNRYWNVTSPASITDSLLVRFPYTAKDFTDLQGANPGLSSHPQIRFFKVDGTQNPFSLSVPAASFFAYANAAAPSLTTWRWSQQDSNFLCDYYVRSFGGGSGGTAYAGPLSDESIPYVSVSPVSAAPNASLTVSFIEKNTGAAAAGAHKVNLYLSADNQLTPGANGDVLLGQQPVTAVLAAGASTDTLRKQINIPCNAAAGNYTLFVVADGENVLAEVNEQNNVASVSLAVTSGSALPPTPVINASPSATICAPGNVVLTATAGACPGCTFTWSDGQSGLTATTYFSQTLTFTATNACGSSSASQAVTIRPQPPVTASMPNGFCQNTPTPFTASGALSYVWTGPGLSSTTGSTVTVTAPASGQVTYTITGTDAFGCTKTVAYSPTVYITPTVDIVQSNVILCAGSSIALQATSTNAETNAWSPVTGLSVAYGLTTVATPSVSTTYYLTAISIMGCKAKDSVAVTVQPAGNCTPLPDLVIGSQSISPVSLTSGGSLNAVFTETNGGTAAAGAHKVQFYLSPDNQLTPGANGDVLLGEQAIGSLVAGANTGALTKQLILPCGTTAGTYSVFFVADGGGAVAESSENNNVSAAPQTASVAALAVTASPDTAVCGGATVTLRATSNAAAAVLTWNGAGLNNTTGSPVSALPTANTAYTVTAALNGCTAADTVNVSLLPSPALNVSASPASVCPGGSSQLTASGAATYSWSPAAGLNATSGAAVTATPGATTAYTVNGTGTNGCTAAKSVSVTVSPVVTPTIGINYTGCPSSTLQFTSAVTNGGTNPVVVWYVNNTPSGTGLSFTLPNGVNGTQVYAKLASNAACVSSSVATSAVTAVTCIITGIPNVTVLEGYSLSPNPTSGKMEVTLKLAQRKSVSFELSDGFGKRLLITEPVAANGRFVKKLDLSGLAQGTYFLRITVGTDTFVEKVVIAR